MAEARCATEKPRIKFILTEEEQKRDIYRHWRRSIARRFYRTRNLIHNGLWPTSPWNLGAVVLVFSMAMVQDWQFCKSITDRLWSLADTLYIPSGCPDIIRAVLASFIAGVWLFIFVLYLRRYLLRSLLSYQGWLYEKPKTQSVSTLAWGLLVRCLFGYSPILYSCQQSLPKMSVPPLKETLDKLMESLRPLYGEDSEEWKTIVKDRKEFEKSLGPKLQGLLVLKSWWSPNYVTDWWEKYVYLSSRSPLVINSNYYIMDHSYWRPTKLQLHRIATTCHQYLIFNQMVIREELEPLVIRKTIPICMAQYERMFSTTRIPGEDRDRLLHTDSAHSKYIVVLCKGLFYKVVVYDKKGKLITTRAIYSQLKWIQEDAEKKTEEHTEAEKSIAVFTALERTDWAKKRVKYFSSGVNRESLDIIEKAIFFVCLTDEAFEDFSSRAKYLLCGGRGTSVWFDKSINLISFSDGRFGLNCEHSYADAPVIGHLHEYTQTQEILENKYTTQGECLQVKEDLVKQDPLAPPQRLIWDLNQPMTQDILEAKVKVQEAIDDLELCLRDHDKFGKGFIKSCKVSPDAFIQMALQLTYYKNAGKFALTYESSMTRLFRQGRTETVRSLTMEAADFVRAFVGGETSKKELQDMFRKACDKHQDLYRDAMCGKGIDRHLFALYVASKGMGYDCAFLKDALTIPWTLSTSQQPQQQVANAPDCNLEQYHDKLCPGGGFGPVSDDGYGVSYMIPGDHKIFFHVSAKKSTPKTSAVKFMDQLFESLDQLRTLFSKDNGTTKSEDKENSH